MKRKKEDQAPEAPEATEDQAPEAEAEKTVALQSRMEIRRENRRRGM